MIYLQHNVQTTDKSTEKLRICQWSERVLEITLLLTFFSKLCYIRAVIGLQQQKFCVKKE